MTRKYFFFGLVHPDPSGEKRITMSEDFRVEGGTKTDHDRVVEIIQEFSEGVRKDGIHCADMIMKDIVKRRIG